MRILQDERVGGEEAAQRFLVAAEVVLGSIRSGPLGPIRAGFCSRLLRYELP